MKKNIIEVSEVEEEEEKMTRTNDLIVVWREMDEEFV